MSDVPWWKKIFSGANPIATVVADTVVETANGIADIADRFIENPQERAAFKLEMEKVAMEKRRVAMEKDAAILADRQSARSMAGVHGKLQSRFALTFLIAFFVLVFAELAFIGMIIFFQTREGATPIPDWIQVLVSTTLAGVLGYMASMLKEVTGFLFGGSAGSDDQNAALTEALATSSPPNQ